MKDDIKEKVEQKLDFDWDLSEKTHVVRIDIRRFHELICMVSLVLVLLSKGSEHMEFVGKVSSQVTRYSTLITFVLKELKQIQFRWNKNQDVRASIVLKFI